MSLSLLLTCGWVVAVTTLAFLPIRLQIIPGLIMLLIAPILIWMLAQDFGWLAVALFMFALVSMFRRPLIYFIKRLLGRKPEVPE